MTGFLYSGIISIARENTFGRKENMLVHYQNPHTEVRGVGDPIEE
jgi:hypothetical protein